MTIRKIVVSVILAVFVFLPVHVFSDSSQVECKKRMGPPPKMNIGFDMLSRFQAENIMLTALQELTGASSETIQKHLENRSLKTFMEEKGIDSEKLESAIFDKTISRINEAAGSGYISDTQKEEIIKEMNAKKERMETMKKVISKSVENGTITEEQAKTLVFIKH